MLSEHFKPRPHTVRSYKLDDTYKIEFFRLTEGGNAEVVDNLRAEYVEITVFRDDPNQDSFRLHFDLPEDQKAFDDTNTMLGVMYSHGFRAAQGHSPKRNLDVV